MIQLLLLRKGRKSSWKLIKALGYWALYHNYLLSFSSCFCKAQKVYKLLLNG